MHGKLKILGNETDDVRSESEKAHECQFGKAFFMRSSAQKRRRTVKSRNWPRLYSDQESMHNSRLRMKLYDSAWKQFQRKTSTEISSMNEELIGNVVDSLQRPNNRPQIPQVTSCFILTYLDLHNNQVFFSQLQKRLTENTKTVLELNADDCRSWKGLLRKLKICGLGEGFVDSHMSGIGLCTYC